MQKPRVYHCLLDTVWFDCPGGDRNLKNFTTSPQHTRKVIDLKTNQEKISLTSITILVLSQTSPDEEIRAKKLVKTTNLIVFLSYVMLAWKLKQSLVTQALGE